MYSFNSTHQNLIYSSYYIAQQHASAFIILIFMSCNIMYVYGRSCVYNCLQSCICKNCTSEMFKQTKLHFAWQFVEAQFIKSVNWILFIIDLRLYDIIHLWIDLGYICIYIYILDISYFWILLIFVIIIIFIFITMRSNNSSSWPKPKHNQLISWYKQNKLKASYLLWLHSPAALQQQCMPKHGPTHQMLVNIPIIPTLH